MKVKFLGTGEACDPDRRNTSLLLEENGCLHLLDCGFTSAQALLNLERAERLETVWISHFHGDHFLGLPQLLLDFHLKKRELPLTIYSGTEPEEKVIAALQLAYPGVHEKLCYPLRFQKLIPGDTMTYGDLIFQSAPMSHSQPSFCIRVNLGSKALFYSGDGKPTLEAVKLMKNCDVVIHEAYTMSPRMPSHFSIEECILLAQELEIPQLALLHLSVQTRMQLEENFTTDELSVTTKMFFPKDGDECTI